MSLLEYSGPVVDNAIRPLMDCINQPGVAEVLVNRAGEVWIERHGETAEPVKHKAFSVEYFRSLGQTIANRLNVVDFPNKPYLATMLPGRHRLQLCLGNTIESGIAVSVRVQNPHTFPLDAYIPTKADLDAINHYTPQDRAKFDNPIEELRDAVERKLNTVLIGGTFTGKTSFAKEIINGIPSTDRVGIIQDSSEIAADHLPNRVNFLVNRLATTEQIGYAEVIDAVTRLRFDRVIVGELSMENTWTLLRLLNTGLGGLLTTLHANSPALAFDAITQNIALSGRTNDPRGATEYFRSVIDVIAQIQRVPNSSRRVLTNIYRKGDTL